MPTQQQPNALQVPGTPEGRKQKGTGFTNIRNLLQANVGAGAAMGTALGGGISQKAGQLGQDVQTAGQQFGQQYQTEREKAFGQGGTIAGVTNYLSGTQDLSSLSPEEAEKIGKQMRETQYAGPTELANQQALLSRAGNLQALGTLAGMGSIGQGRLLQGIGTRRGGYSRGQGLLDQYLVGQDVGAQQAIRQGATEAFGAAQQAQTGASVAQQQAQGLKQSIEAQKQEAQQNVLKQLASTQEQATQSAKQYLNQAERLKKYFTKDLPVEQLTEQDKQAISDLSKYGLDPVSITTADDPQQILNALANAGVTQFAGQQKYDTDAQQKAARNLALLSGQSDVAQKIGATKFDTQLFKDANQQIQAITKPQEQLTKRLETSTGITDPIQAQKAADKYNAGMDALRRNNRYGEGIDMSEDSVRNSHDFLKRIYNPTSNAPGSFVREAYDLLGKNTYLAIVNRIKDESGIGDTPYQRNRIIDALASVYEQKLNDINQLNDRYKKTTTLQDYLRKQAGIVPQQGS